MDGHPVTSPSPANLPHRRAATAWRVVREVESHIALGPQGEVLVEFLDALRDLTDVEAEAMGALWGAGWSAAVGAGRSAAMGAGRSAAMVAAPDAALRSAWGTTWAAAWVAGCAAALALVVADLVGQHGLTRDHLDTLTGPARAVPRLAAIIDRALPTKEN